MSTEWPWCSPAFDISGIESARSHSASMKVLVVGSGGREHALVWKLAQSPHASRIICAPGNAGIAAERLVKSGAPVECASIAAEDLLGLAELARTERIDLTVVGPDNPLALGIVDLFQSEGLRIWGRTAVRPASRPRRRSRSASW